MEPFEVLGTWWFPGDEESSFEALLKLTAEQGIVLLPTHSSVFSSIVIRRFGSKNALGNYAFWGKDREVEVVLGKGINDDTAYALHYCVVNTWRLRAGYVIQGHRFHDTPLPSNYDEYSIGFSGIDEWGAVSRFNERQVGNTLTVTHELSSTIQRIEAKLAKAVVKVGQWIEPKPSTASLTLNQRTEFRVIPRTGDSISVPEAIEYYSNMLRNLMMLATREYTRPIYLRGWYRDDQIKRYVDVFWIGKGFGMPKPDYGIGTWVFWLGELSTSLETALQKWEENREQLNPFTRNYFANRYLQSTYLEINFVSYVQALEAHQKKRNPDFKCIKGESCLKQRLVDILNVSNAVTDIQSLVGSDNSEFAQIVVNVRNDLTHEADLKIPPYELGDITRRLEVIILLTMYVVLQFPPDLIESAKKRLMIGLASWDARD